MPAEFEPLLKKNHGNLVETFVSGDESMTIMTNILVSAGLMILAMMITWMFIWSFQKDHQFFISIVSIVAFLFAIENIIIILVNMSHYDPISFKISMGSNVLSAVIFFIMSVYFFVRYVQTQRASSGYGTQYIPQNVQSYINQ